VIRGGGDGQIEYEVRDGYYVVAADGASRFDGGDRPLSAPARKEAARARNAGAALPRLVRATH
jgi:hypothetical protein